MRFNLTKHVVLAELASVIGQLCNDDDMEKEMCKKEHNTIQRLLDIFHNATPGSRVRSKVMFALKQMCARPRSGQDEVDRKELLHEVIDPIVREELVRMMRVSKGEDL